MAYYVVVAWEMYRDRHAEPEPPFDMLVAYEQCMDPEKADEMCYALKVDLYGSHQVLIPDLQEYWQQHNDVSTHIRLLYESKEDGLVWFKTFIPDSSACCGVIAFSPHTQEFYDTGTRIDQMVGDIAAPSGQWYATLQDETTIMIVDLANLDHPQEISVAANETISQTRCGYDGSYMNVTWLDDTTFQYGVYDAESFQDEARCDYEFIRYETASVR